MRSLAAVAALAAVLAPAALVAQQTQLDLHGDYAYGTASHASAWGAGAGVQVTLGGKSAPVQLSLSPSVDWTRQQGGGSSQTSASLDVDAQPGGGATVTPYVGVSAGANWSGGSSRQWSGTKLGLETLAGAQVKLGGPKVSAKVEERFGYVNGQEHMLTTRFGVLIGL